MVLENQSENLPAIPIDQAHEQNNATIKGDGGAVGLFDKNETLERWSTSGPEVMRTLNGFHENELKCHVSSILHHDHTKSTQFLFVAGCIIVSRCV